jgi:hypothetical protein
MAKRKRKKVNAPNTRKKTIAATSITLPIILLNPGKVLANAGSMVAPATIAIIRNSERHTIKTIEMNRVHLVVS